MSDRVYIFDTTLRDGEQSPGCSMTVPEKLRMARKLVDLGVDILEAGFPIASEGDFEAVRAVSREFPWAQVAALIGRIVTALGDCAIVSVHCHDDLGLAVANSLAAVEAGARQIECTINGIGERAGNCSLEEVVMILKTRPDAYPYHTGVNTEHLYAASELLSSIITFGPQPNKAIVGRNAFAHEA